MKKLFIILTACFASLGMMKAANTDISALDNIIYVDPFSAEANSQVYLSFKMKNSETIRGFQFKISLPTGVTVVDDSQVFAENRKSGATDDHTLAWSNQTDGTLLFLCGTSTLKAFKGNDGEVVRVIIDIPDGLAAGDYPVLLTEMKLNGTEGSYTTESIETTLTITGTSDGTIKLNENSTTLPVPVNGATVKVTRNLVGGVWNTLCLPFKMTKAQVQETFGSSTLVGTLESVEEDGEGGFVVSFKSRTTSGSMIQANTPIIIKPDYDITEFTLESVDISNPQAIIAVSNDAGDAECTFFGTQVAGTVIPANYLFINGSKFYYSKGTTTIKGFRSYLYIDGFDPTASSAPTFVVDGETTSIDEINIVDGDGRIYNLNGQHVENPTSKGVYIQNGKKVVIKK